MFKLDALPWDLVFITLVGTLISYARATKKSRRVYGLSDILETYLSERFKILIEPVIFVLLGTLVGMMLGIPSNAPQAFAAGIGWTALATR